MVISHTSSFPIIETSYGNVPILLNFPHSGRIYPDDQLVYISDCPKLLRIFEDPYLDIILPDVINCSTSLILNHYARAFIDVNRDLKLRSDTPSLNGQSMGLIPCHYPCGKPLYIHHPSRLHIQSRIDNIYKPYHQIIQKVINNMKKTYPKLLLIDCHSMPSIGGRLDPDAYKARPDIIIGDHFGSTIDHNITKVIENSFIEKGFSTFRNYPYSGGYITTEYSDKKNGIHTIQIEINRNTYMDEKTLLPTENAKKIHIAFQYMLSKVKAYLLGHTDN